MGQASIQVALIYDQYTASLLPHPLAFDSRGGRAQDARHTQHGKEAL